MEALLTIITVCVLFNCGSTQLYTETGQLHTDKFGASSNYNPDVRPLVDQSKVMNINITCAIVNIVEVNAVQQTFTINAFINIFWMDELLPWDEATYNHTKYIHPKPNQVWRPRLILVNTVGERDLFEDDYTPLTVFPNGRVFWVPGSTFQSSCKLSLYKYPFDSQVCGIQMYTMGLIRDEILFTAQASEVSREYFIESGEWELVGSKIEAFAPANRWPNFLITFEIVRRPGFFIINIIIPVVLLSFLSILVFVLPVDSGEKVGYATTVLLALTVYMSIISAELPQSADVLPLVTIYLLVLTIISVLSVITSILVVYHHHKREKETDHKKAKANYNSLVNKLKLSSTFGSKSTTTAKNYNNNNKVFPDSDSKIPDNSQIGQFTVEDLDSKPPIDKHNLVAKMFMTKAAVPKQPNTNTNSLRDTPMHADSGDNANDVWIYVQNNLDFLIFLAFTFVWLSVTFGFIIEIAR